MKIEDIFPLLEQLAPLGYAEDFDNVGLLVGNKKDILKGILVCHDALENVVDEAIAKDCNLIICFHPILFSALKKITGKNYVERAIIKSIKNDIAIYAIHTALDNHQEGVNAIFAKALGLSQTKILIPKENYIQKLVTYAPIDKAENIKKALFSAGAGKIGNYYDCSFTSNGIGGFTGNDASNPIIGKINNYTEVDEIKIEVTFEKHLQTVILQKLREVHEYDEVAYEVYSLLNKHQNIGLGSIGILENEISETEFLRLVQTKMQAPGIRHSAFTNKNIKKVAVLGGSGSFAIKAAIAAGADAFVTADLKYHNYYEAENKLLLADIGHFESERFTKNYIVDYLKEKITNFAPLLPVGKIILSEENTNPVQYF